jgi:alkanesulfonate monooxygenase SsuD/methylene tetrahydromethanopterin reductase-like flavin-dependent oxidoreductase (luciferase family)
MEIGLLFTFRNPPRWARPDADLYRDTLDEIALADRLGFDGVWLAEHHFTDDGWSPSALTLAAAVAVRTERARIGTFVLLLPQHDPVRVAEAATAVDILSGGRLTLGVGIGYRANEETPVGLSPSTRGARMDEGLEVLVRCLADEHVDFEGNWYNLKDVTMTPRPVQRPRPPVLTAGLGQRSLERSARLGCEGLAIHPPREAYDRYVEVLQRHGRDPSAQRFATIVLGYAGPTDDDAWSTVGPHADWIWEHYRTWLLASGEADLFANGARQDFIIGSTQRWVDSIGGMLAANPGVPCHHLVVELVMAGMTHEARTNGIEYFAREVVPGLRAL